jgi:RNA polymerase sigma factor for flagellar operon FliA
VKRTIEELWEAWHANRGRAERDALVVHYQPLVETVAKGHIQSSYSRDWDRLDDAKASGQFGLIDAIERYDPAMGAKFETYAQRRIKGAIHDAGRQQGTLPRSVFDEARRLQHAEEWLTHKLGRTPTLMEVAGHLQVSVEEADRLRRSAAETSFSVDIHDLPLLAEAKPDRSSIGQTGDDLIDTAEFRAAVADAVRQIDGPARIVFGLYYFKAMRMLDIGKLMGISAGTVSKLHTQAVVEIRRLMEQWDQTSSSSSSSSTRS